MSNLISILETEAEKRTPAQALAVAAHNRLLYDKQMVDISFEAMCGDLKEIRDQKHYITLGYEDFGEYTEREHGIGQRQAYKYIRAYEQFGGEFLNSSSKIGITKLLAIAALDKDDREELLAEHTVDELASMSTSEVKRLTEQIKKLEDQISFLETEKDNAPLPTEVVLQPFDEIAAEIRAELENEYAEKIAELESKSVSDDELQKYKANAEKEAKVLAVAEVKKAKEESAEELKKLKADLKATKDAQKSKDDAVKKAEEAQKAAEERAKQGEAALIRAAELEAKIAAAEAEKSAIEKQIKLSSDPELARFKFLFESWQNSMIALVQQLDKLEADKQVKMKTAIKTVLESLGL